MTRYFRYTGPETLTRGDYGVAIRGGHTPQDDPEAIAVFDPDFGDMTVISVAAGIECGEWEEISKGEYDAL